VKVTALSLGQEEAEQALQEAEQLVSGDDAEDEDFGEDW
jgi:hypothetical protein